MCIGNILLRVIIDIIGTIGKVMMMMMIMMMSVIINDTYEECLININGIL